MYKKKSILLLIILVLTCSCDNGSKHSTTTVNLKTPSTNCFNPILNEDCNNKALKNANLILRKLNSTNIAEVEANKSGALYISAEPGIYEIGLSRRYAYTIFMEYFGEMACKFDDNLNDGNGACEQAINSCYATRISPTSSYPQNYNPNSDPGYERFLGMTEAIGTFTIDKKDTTVKLEFGLRCI